MELELAAEFRFQPPLVDSRRSDLLRLGECCLRAPSTVCCQSRSPILAARCADRCSDFAMHRPRPVPHSNMLILSNSRHRQKKQTHTKWRLNTAAWAMKTTTTTPVPYRTCPSPMIVLQFPCVVKVHSSFDVWHASDAKCGV